MTDLLADLRYAVRVLRKSPGFTAVAIVALAIGIGANVTIFSIANTFLLRQLPIADPSSAIRVYRDRDSNSSYLDYADFRDRNRTLDGLAAYQVAFLSLRTDDAPVLVAGEAVTGDYFSVLGLRPALGRLFTAEDTGTPGAAPIAVLRHGYWLSRFGRDPAVLGRTIALNGVPFTVVGVGPPGYTSALPPYVADVWVPLAMDPVLRPGRDRLLDRVGAMENSVHMIGRLKPGVTLAQAQADLSSIATALQREYPNSHANRTVTAHRARTLHDGLDQFATMFMTLLMAIVANVLLVACVNLANLLLARGLARRRELAVRQALGVGRGRVIRLLFAESLVIASLGGAAGELLALWVTAVISQFSLPMSMPMVIDVGLDRAVLAFTCGVSIVAALLFGVLPSLHASRGDLVAALKSGEPLSSHAHLQARLRASFIVAQVALSVVLLVAAALVMRSVAGARAVNPGFQIEGVLALTVDLEVRGYNLERGTRLYRDMLERVRALPGVTEAGVTQTIPLTLWNFGTAMVKDGDPVPSRERRQADELVYGTTISPRYLATIGIPLIAGRDFTDDDGPARAPVIIVNETTAQRFWPGESAIGKRLRELSGGQTVGPSLEVIGVARNANYGRYGEPPLSYIYRPLAQNYSTSASLLVRSASGSAGMAAAVEREIHRIDADLPVFDINPLSVATSISLLPARIAGTLFAVFGGLALLLATIGLYGVMSYLVRQRRREIAVRLALGAERSHVMAVVVSQGMRWAALGLVVGGAAAVVLVRSAAALLPGVRAFDPLTLVIITGILAATALTACGIPAWRASCVDPLAALRQD